MVPEFSPTVNDGLSDVYSGVGTLWIAEVRCPFTVCWTDAIRSMQYRLSWKSTKIGMIMKIRGHGRLTPPSRVRRISLCLGIVGTRAEKESDMADSVYKVIELIGTSTESWEKAAAAAVMRAGDRLRDLRIAEISELDMHLKDGKIHCYRAKVKVSFKYESGD